MNKNNLTFYRFSKSLLILFTAAICLSSCAVNPEQSGKPEPFKFVQICDTQLGFGGYEHDMDSFRQAVRQVNELNPDFVVICGDLVNDAGEQSFSDFKQIKDTLRVPCYYVPGNHDIGKKATPQSLQNYRKTLGKDYFVLEHKGTAFVFVNTQLWKSPLEGESDKQDVWLKESLETASGKDQKVFIVGHYPLFLKAADEPDEYMNLPLEKRTELLELFDQHNVVAVLTGHTHKLTINSYKDIQMVGGDATSKNFDKRPLGFRLWQVEKNSPPKHKFIPLRTN